MNGKSTINYFMLRANRFHKYLIQLNSFLVRYLLFLLFFWVSPVAANECNKEDQDYADSWKNYYVPEDAYAFGVKVQSLILNKDLSGVYSLVEDELKNGPKKKFVTNKSFSEVFDEEWVKKVLEDDVPCSPVGWRGFMLGNGLIWYNKLDKGWKILSINSVLEPNTTP